MSYIQPLSSMLEKKLSTATLMRFLATDGLLLESYSGEFLLAVYEDSWVLSLLGNDTSFYSKNEVQIHFDNEYARLFNKPTESYIYGNSGFLVRADSNSALIALAQVRQEHLSLC